MKPHLDRLCAVSVSRNGDYVEVTFPYRIAMNATNYAVVDMRTMRCYMLKPISATVCRVIEDADSVTQGANTMYGGQLYNAEYVFSEQFLRPTAMGGNMMTNQGRLQFRRWRMTYGMSEYFEVVVSQKGVPGEFVYKYNGPNLGVNTNSLGVRRADSGAINIPVKSLSSRTRVSLRNNTHFRSSFLSAEWEAFYTTRNRRI